MISGFPLTYVKEIGYFREKTRYVTKGFSAFRFTSRNYSYDPQSHEDLESELLANAEVAF